MKRPKLGINFYKVVIGVGFSLLWARIMYLIWPEPEYITFVWFYLLVGSVILKWGIFEIVDRIHLRVRIRTVRGELAEASKRVHELTTGDPEVDGQQMSITGAADVGFAQRLEQLEDDVLAFGSMVETALRSSVESLQHRDVRAAARIISQDQKLDHREFAIRADCMSLLAADYASGSDLRMIVAVLGIIKELERMGDYAKGIANITLAIGNQPPLKPLIDIPRMAQIGTEMLRGSLESLVERDLEKAKRISQMDNDVDGIYDQVFRELVLFMVEDPKTITRATRLIWVAHNLERFADRITNICEYVALSITEEMVDMGSSEH